MASTFVILNSGLNSNLLLCYADLGKCISGLHFNDSLTWISITTERFNCYNDCIALAFVWNAYMIPASVKDIIRVGLITIRRTRMDIIRIDLLISNISNLITSVYPLSVIVQGRNGILSAVMRKIHVTLIQLNRIPCSVHNCLFA